MVPLSVIVVGVLWELVNYFVVRWRREKDWPALFGLVGGVPEGMLIWILLSAGAIPGSGLAASEPVCVPFIRGFGGGRRA
jgi:hypothetical protein